MKLNLIINFNIKESDNYGSSDDGRIAPASSEYIRESNIHMHENYHDFGKFIIYRGFKNVSFRSRYSDVEHALIDVPDELVFQFMLLGIKDYDFIVYNHITKRILLGTDASNLVYFASSNENIESLQHRNGIMIRSVSYNNSNSISERFFDFDTNDNSGDDDDERPDMFLFEVNKDNGYSDFMEVLTPHINHKFVKDVHMVTTDLNYIESSGGMPVPENYTSNMTKFSIPREDVSFVFLSFLNSDPVWDDNEHKFPPKQIELIRTHTLKLWKKFTENTQDI